MLQQCGALVHKAAAASDEAQSDRVDDIPINKCSSSSRKGMKQKHLYCNTATGLLPHSTMKCLSNCGILLHHILVHFMKAALKTKKLTITIWSIQYSVTLAAVLPIVYAESLAVMLQNAGSSTPVHFLLNLPSLLKSSQMEAFMRHLQPIATIHASIHTVPATAALEG